MKRVFWTVLLLFAVASQYASALQYITFEKVTVNGAPTSFTLNSITAQTGQHPQANFAQCRASLAEMRYVIDSHTASATVGTLIEPGDIITLQGNDVLQNFRAIITGLTTGQLDCIYYLP